MKQVGVRPNGVFDELIALQYYLEAYNTMEQNMNESLT
jgi:hypothetical protein